MISYGYPNCISCHVAVQGRGLLNSYGRGIDIAQSYSHEDYTARIFGRSPEPGEEASWDGRFGNTLLDFVLSSRINHHPDTGETDSVFSGLYRQILFFGERDQCRINAEIGFREPRLKTWRYGPHLSTTGGDDVFLKKLTFEWRLEDNGSSGKELVIGRDYLPIGLQIEDDTTFILSLTRNGLYDFPLQLKYFAWDENSLGSIFVHAPTFEESAYYREYGGGFLYERYPARNLALGVHGVAGFADESDRLRAGAYARWGPSSKWAVLAEIDYSHFWNAGAFDDHGGQITSFFQLFFYHREWLISSVAANYAWSDQLSTGNQLYSLKYALTARLNRSLSVGVSYAVGDILRDLSHGQEAAIFAAIKF